MEFTVQLVFYAIYTGTIQPRPQRVGISNQNSTVILRPSYYVHVQVSGR